MKKFFALMLVVTLLTTVFSINVVEAKSKDVSLTGEIIKVNQGESRNGRDVLALKCEEGDYILVGKVKGLSDYINSIVTVKGTIFKFYKSEFMKVKDYEIVEETKPAVTSKPLPTSVPKPVITQVPSPDFKKLKGILFSNDSEKDRFLLKTERGIYELMGNTKGLENEFENTLLVSGDYVYTLVATEYPLFSVNSYTVIEEPTPTPIPTPTSDVYTITIDDNGGYVYIKPGEEVKMELETNPSTGYDWSYIMKPDKDVLIETNYEYVPDNTDEMVVGSGGKGVWTYKAVNSGTVVIEMGYSRPWESVEPIETFAVKVIVDKQETITGTLEVLEPEIAEGGWQEYGYELKTESGPVTLNGKTKGLEKYNGQEVEVTGEYSMLKIYPPIFIVETYKLVSTPIPTPIPDVYTITMDDNGGYVYIKPGEEVKLELDTNPSTGYDWSYIMKPDEDVLIETNYEYVPDNTDEMVVGGGGKGVWTYKAVNSGTVVIEMGYSRPWESVEPAEKFIVKIIIEDAVNPEPTVIPVPTVKPVLEAHTVISEKALGFSLPKVSVNDVSGCTTISWTEGTENAFFYSKLNVDKDIYEFELVSVKESDSEKIIGLFNIKKNGKLLMKEITGRLYGLSFQEGKYFKFYSEDEMCHMSAYITKRMDF